MKLHIVDRVASTLPVDDVHPYRTGAWRPNVVEYDATELDVVAGAIPDDLCGVYLRNTENPVHDAIGLYHPFDGDGMLHMIAFGNGEATYRNRFVRTDGFVAEQAEAESLWAGLLAAPTDAKRADGWGARGRMKDASSTDVVVHRGRALTSFYQCGDVYAHDPYTLEPLGKETWVPAGGISAHTKVDEHTGELLVFNYGKDAPFMHYGVVDAAGELVHYTPVPLPGPRLPHDMAFTEHYAVLNDLPLFWDPQLLTQGAHVPRFFRDIPSRFAVIPRRGTVDDIVWFEAEPTYVLHWINAYEDGDEIVLDGFRQHQPEPPKRADAPKFASIYRYLDLHQLRTKAHRWRFNLATGETKEEELSDTTMEFGMINGRHGGRPYRYTYNMTGVEGWFLFDGIVKHDVVTGAETRYAFGDGVFGSETPFAPRSGATASAEDDGYLVTFTTDVNNDCSECLVLDAADIAAGPIARIRLPERISSGTHSYWLPG
ncbi:MAG TPA: carotenoid oxygenase family protein [Acidimicrobiales bacterium]|nr:carotenoid oxygenase family protein [Acidimicrobiales bacterium]